MGNARKDYVFRKLDELKQAIEMDTFNLSRNSQNAIEFKLDELRKMIEGQYSESSSGLQK